MPQPDSFEAIYAELPQLDCKGLCYDACEGGIPSPPGERARLPIQPLPRTTGPTSDPCPALNAFGRCSIYEVRPLICRLWGSTPAIPCHYGCLPTTPFTDADASALIARLEALGGQAV